MRENYDIDEPLLRDYARISSYRDTWADDADYSDLLMAIEEIDLNSKVEKHDFQFAMPQGVVYTKWSDFKNVDARNTMEEYVAVLNEFETTNTALQQLRRRYADGATELSDMILKMEEKLRDDRVLLRRLANDVIRLEQNN